MLGTVTVRKRFTLVHRTVHGAQKTSHNSELIKLSVPHHPTNIFPVCEHSQPTNSSCRIGRRRSLLNETGTTLEGVAARIVARKT